MEDPFYTEFLQTPGTKYFKIEDLWQWGLNDKLRQTSQGTKVLIVFPL